MDLVDRESVLAAAAAAAVAAVPRAYAQDSEPIRIPYTLTDSRVLADCTVAGRGPFRIVLDTGGGSREAARASASAWPGVEAQRRQPVSPTGIGWSAPISPP